MEQKSIFISILDNSHAFFVEAVEKVVSAQDDIRSWQFAILHLIQSLELTFKEVLRRNHPVLIYEDIDRKKHTVSITKALERLKDPEIENLQLTKDELRGIDAAIKMRNELVHSEFHLTLQHAEANFFIVFNLLAEIQSKLLQCAITEIIPDKLLQKIIYIEKTRETLINQANELIENIDPKLIKTWDCPECLANTFVAYLDESEGSCFTCKCTKKLTQCAYCNHPYFEDEIESFLNALETDDFEGRTTIHNDFGYENYLACQKCTPRILEDIDRQRDEEDYRY